MKKFRITRQASPERLSAACAALARVLLICTMVLVTIMPWTEYFWHFDRFLHGGQDFELSLLALLTVFCLMLILFQIGSQNVQLRLDLRHWLTVLLRSADARMTRALRAGCPHAVMPLPSVMLDKYNLPLQV